MRSLPPDPSRGLSDQKQSGVKGRKVRLTYAFTTNASGSEKLKPFIIGKAQKPRPFKGKTGEDLGFYYRNNVKAWMTGELYQNWIHAWDEELEAKGQKILLLQDNFSGHIVPNDLKNIEVKNLAPNLTAHIQPMDQGIIKSFKAHYRAHYIQCAVTTKRKLRCAQPPKLGVRRASPAAPRGARPASVALGDDASKWGEKRCIL